MLSKNIENKSATNQPAVMFAVNITWYRCVQRYPVARYTNGTRTQGCQVMFTAKITANHIPKYKRPISFLSFLMDLFSRLVKTYWKQECKKSAVRGWFFRLLDARSVIFSDFGGPGALFGEPGPQFEDFWNYYDFGGRSGTKGDTHFETHFNNFQLFAVLFFYVFSSACFFDFLWF